VWVALEDVEACWERVRRAGPSTDGTGGGRTPEILPEREELAMAPPREESLFPPRLDKLAWLGLRSIDGIPPPSTAARI
jgi:hypothetical protein